MSSSSKEQLEQLQRRFMALPLRERIIISSGAGLLLLATIYIALLSPFYKAVHDRAAHVVQKQQDLAWMKSMAPQLRAMGNAHPLNNRNESLVVIIASTAGRASIASSLAGQTPNGNNSVRVRLEACSSMHWSTGLAFCNRSSASPSKPPTSITVRNRAW
jgi:type II secretory pathway component PulM